jgi:hypothetical protein
MRRLLPLFFVASGLVIGCSCSDQPPVPCHGTSCTDAHVDGHVEGGTTDGAATRTITMLSITPTDPTITLRVGMTGTQMFMVSAMFSDGTWGNVGGTWSLGSTAIGDIDPTGLFTANGARGGTTTVTFTPTANGGATIMTTVTVRLVDIIVPTGSNADTMFTAAGAPMTDPAQAATIVYPLDHVVFPQNMTAPVVQWTGGAVGDLFRITYAKPDITITQYLTSAAGFTFSGQIPDPDFSRLAETDPTIDATITVDRLDATTNHVYAGTPVHAHFAQGSVSGTVYYWAMDEGHLHRIPAGTVRNDQLFPGGIMSTTNHAYTYTGCIACHQISRDGRYLAANGNDSYVFDLTMIDPSMPNQPATIRPGFRWYFSTISPDDTRVFATSPTATFQYTNLMIQDVTPTGTVPSANVAHPSWSPDGHTVAFISNVQGWTSIAAFTGGDLTTVHVDTSTDTFSNLTVIHHGADLATSDPAMGSADCFPSWTPDSHYIVFDHTPTSRGTGGGRAPGSLYMIPPTGGAPVRLATASDDTGGPHTHYPNLSPFVSGGYYWIVFYSTRDYGNTLAGTAGTARPQLWVSALATSFDGTHDPSSVPYWLPGQDRAHQNADAVWAASPCRMTGSSCSTSSDCCTGACQPAADGGYACVPPMMCRREGESCEHDTDCCGNPALTCFPDIHTCQRPPS